MFLVVLVVLAFFSLPVVLLWLGFRRFNNKARREVEANSEEQQKNEISMAD